MIVTNINCTRCSFFKKKSKLFTTTPNRYVKFCVIIYLNASTLTILYNCILFKGNCLVLRLTQILMLITESSHGPVLEKKNLHCRAYLQSSDRDEKAESCPEKAGQPDYPSQ